jgi:hypothetical protein
MRKAALALAVLSIGQPALATDLIYQHDKGKPEVLAPYNGFAHWQLEAYCSGMMKARLDYDRQRGRKFGPAEAGATYFETEAVARYIADRGADKAKAQAVVTYYEDQAKAQFRDQVAQTPGDTGRTPANMRMTECAAIAAALSPPAAVPPKLLAADPMQQKVVCEEVRQTGSNRVKRICRTQAEADQIARESRDTTQRIQELGGCRNGGGCN